MRIDVLSIFPEILQGYLQQSLLKRAIERGLVQVRLWNIRDWATGKHKSVDDKPFGGGPGMLLCCQPVFDSVEEVRSRDSEPGQLVMLTPQGRRLDQELVTQLSQMPRLLLLCGRYEGFDERIRSGLKPLEVSVGDFICNGGEVPAMLIIDSVIRMVPGVLGDETSIKYESFSETGLLEYPQFTRPREFRGMKIPDVLLSGDHQAIARWKQAESLKRTRERRRQVVKRGRPQEGTGQCTN